MKKWIFFFLLAQGLAFAGLEETPRQNNERYVLEGSTLFGNYVNCQLFNETQNEMEVLRYVYELTYVDGFGRVQNQVSLYHCATGCRLESFSMLSLSGPQNHRNLLRASCKALVKVIRHDDGNDDLYGLRSPQVFDRWED